MILGAWMVGNLLHPPPPSVWTGPKKVIDSPNNVDDIETPES
jgi:hypothetical protein